MAMRRKILLLAGGVRSILPLALFFLVGFWLFRQQKDERIHRAIRSNKVAEIESLIKESNENLEVRNRTGRTPLLEAAETADTEVVEILIKHGADIYAQSGPEGCNALHMASIYGHLEQGKLLIKAGVPVNGLTKDGRTPLDIAVQNRHAAMADLLRKNGGESGKTIR